MKYKLIILFSLLTLVCHAQLLVVDTVGTGSVAAGVESSGLATQHSDIFSAGSGSVITAAERTAIGTNATNIGTNVTAIGLNTAKVSYTDAAAVALNTAKVTDAALISTIVDASTSGVESNAIFDALALKEDALTLDAVPTNASTNYVNSNSVFDAIAAGSNIGNTNQTTTGDRTLNFDAGIFTATGTEAFSLTAGQLNLFTSALGVGGLNIFSAKTHLELGTSAGILLKLQPQSAATTIGHVFTTTSTDGAGTWQAPLNGIYTGSSSLTGATSVTLSENDFNFTGSNETFSINPSTNSIAAAVGEGANFSQIVLDGDDGLLGLTSNGKIVINPDLFGAGNGDGGIGDIIVNTDGSGTIEWRTPLGTIPQAIAGAGSVDLSTNYNKNYYLTGTTATITNTGTLSSGREINVICANATGCTLTWDLVAGSFSAGSVALGTSIPLADGEALSGSLSGGNWQGIKY